MHHFNYVVIHYTLYTTRLTIHRLPDMWISLGSKLADCHWKQVLHNVKFVNLSLYTRHKRNSRGLTHFFGVSHYLRTRDNTVQHQDGGEVK
jgi:hypothetical protein